MIEIHICSSYKLSIDILYNRFFFFIIIVHTFVLLNKMFKNVLRPDLTDLCWWETCTFPPACSIFVSWQAKKLLCSRHCQVGYNCFRVGVGGCLFWFVLVCFFFFPTECRYCCTPLYIALSDAGAGVIFLPCNRWADWILTTRRQPANTAKWHWTLSPQLF